MAGKWAQNKTHQERRNVCNVLGPVIREPHLIGSLFVFDKANFRRVHRPMGSGAPAVISQPNPSVHLSVHPFLSACIEGNFYILTWYTQSDSSLEIIEWIRLGIRPSFPDSTSWLIAQGAWGKKKKALGAFSSNVVMILIFGRSALMSSTSCFLFFQVR